MNTRAAIPAFLALLATLPFGGCKTTGTDGVDVPPAATILFVPQVRRAVIQSGEGRYPNLFTTASYAVWGPVAGEPAPTTAPDIDTDPADAVMESKPESVPVPADIEAARAGGLTVECHLESEFPDRSIAYDAVGLRGMAIYLELPDGTQIQPAQKTLDSNLVEVPVGALRRYGRKLTLYFSDSQFMVENPAANPEVPGVRLVMNGLESQFFFEWPATPNFLAPMEPSLGQKVAATTRTHLRATRETVSRVSHTMD
jgi:hypothetical protein